MYIKDGRDTYDAPTAIAAVHTLRCALPYLVVPLRHFAGPEHIKSVLVFLCIRPSGLKRKGRICRLYDRRSLWVLKQPTFKTQEDTKLKIKYLKACQEDGLTPEQIKEIDKIFDADKKHRKRDREERRKLGITIISLDSLRNDDPRSETMQIADPRVNVEQEVFQQMAMDYLWECLDEMSEFDRNLLLEFYDGEKRIETQMAKRYGMERMQFRRYRKSLEKQIREKFLKKFGE